MRRARVEAARRVVGFERARPPPHGGVVEAAVVGDEIGIGLGIGTWLLFLLGAALVAAGLGRLRNPLAKD